MIEQTDTTESEENDDSRIDEAMLGFGEFVSQMTDVEGYLVDEEMSTAMRVQNVKMSMPVQLDIQLREDGSVEVGGSPPLYYADTTVLPVFHQLTIDIIAEENYDNHGSHK